MELGLLEEEIPACPLSTVREHSHQDCEDPEESHCKPGNGHSSEPTHAGILILNFQPQELGKK